MPELPEVENIARGLSEIIPGKKILSVDLRRDDILKQPEGQKLSIDIIVGRKVTKVTRRAKRLIIGLTGGAAMLIQLGMTGRFVISDPDSPLEKHAHLVVNLSGNVQLRYVDHRRFGWIWLYEKLNCDSPDDQMMQAGMGKLGPEPFDIQLDEFCQILKSSRVMKNLLLDQTKIAGLGNIYVDESLFMSGIYPETVAEKLDRKQAAALLKAIKAVLKKSIEAGGTSFSDYRNAYGEMGSFLKMLQVYQRTGQLCRKCKTPIEKITISNRSTHFCPNCQKA